MDKILSLRCFRDTNSPNTVLRSHKVAHFYVNLYKHCEVQSQYEAHVDRRIFVYNTKALNLCKDDVISLVILGDTRPSWRHTDYRYSYGGVRSEIKFGSVKLLDYESRWDELESSNNPFSIIIMAHLKTAATTGNLAEQAKWKLDIIQRIYEKGWANKEVVKVYNIHPRN